MLEGMENNLGELGLKPLSGNNLATIPPIHPKAINTFTKKSNLHGKYASRFPVRASHYPELCSPESTKA